jgi:alkanesulfonate monooxygenase SsuD/methylene tetrahydromethanopterin reductase-like flavin-dependent oxidoreductase (luciferase family)
MTEEETRYLVRDIRERAERNGRDPANVLFFPKLNPIVADTEEEALLKLERYLEYSSPEGSLSLLSVWTGTDFSRFGADELLAFIQEGEKRQGSNYLREFFRRNEPDKQWTVEELAKYFAFGGIGSVVAGTPSQIADHLERFADATGVDGFNIAYATRPGTFEEFIDLVVPELQRRGRVQTEYGEGTFRRKLFGYGDKLGPEHPGGKVSARKVRPHE